MNPKHTMFDPRVFLNFSQAPLKSATEWVFRNCQTGDQLDLSGLIIVLPSSRALQRFLQLIVAAAEEAGRELTPPTLVTVGEFPEYLYDIETPLASDLCQQLAWTKALQQTPPWEIEELFGRQEQMTTEQWQPFAQLISGLHRRLGADVWSFRSVVREVKKLSKPFPEVKRWEVLEAIQGRYYDLLTQAGLWDRQAARNVAVRRELCKTDRQVILIGVADLNRAMYKMLEQIRDQVRILVAAPGRMKDRFDEFGGLITPQWLEAEITFPCSHIRIVDRAEDQAFAVCHYLSELNGRFAPDQITIGIPDDAVGPQVERSLNAFGVAHRSTKGQAVRDAGPIQLMMAASGYLEAPDFDAFAALVRHPDMFRWLAKKVHSRTWLSDLDSQQQQGFLDRIEIGARYPFGNADEIRRQHADDAERAGRFVEMADRLNKVHAAVSRLLKPLTAKPKPIADWTEPWSRVLSEIYGDRTLDKSVTADQQTLAACRELYLALHDKQQVPVDWKLDTTSWRAMQIAIAATAGTMVVSPPVTDAIELSGWLDLPLDDADVVVVTGMNDGNVPESECGHLFLPDSLCTDLGIVDNDRRYARDAYALTVITRVRKDFLLIAGRRDQVGEPLKPSRLLFADTDETIARRSHAFFACDGNSNARFWLADPQHAPLNQQFVVPQPKNVEPIDSLRVTAFRDFIKCRYRFYLSAMLKLEAGKYDLQELDGGAFGTLLHLVVEDFGRSELRESTDGQQIMDYLSEQLDRHAHKKYLVSRLPAIRVQVEQLRMRLQRFAPLQAQRASEGWRIVCVEERLEHELSVDGLPFRIRGTIDRVDVNDTTGAVAIWDYKSSDKGDGPGTVHRDKKGWKDLQLPLYRHLVKEVSALANFDCRDLQLGYVLLPKELDKVRFEAASWSPRDLDEADNLAASIIRDIRAGRFWPPERRPPEYTEHLAAICQDAVFERDPVAMAAEAVR